MNLQMLSLYQSILKIHCPTKKLLTCTLMPYYLARCGEWIWYREWILHWKLNLH